MFTPKIGKDEPILTNIFQMGWNHQPGLCSPSLSHCPFKNPLKLRKSISRSGGIGIPHFGRWVVTQVFTTHLAEKNKNTSWVSPFGLVSVRYRNFCCIALRSVSGLTLGNLGFVFSISSTNIKYPSFCWFLLCVPQRGSRVSVKKWGLVHFSCNIHCCFWWDPLEQTISKWNNWKIANDLLECMFWGLPKPCKSGKIIITTFTKGPVLTFMESTVNQCVGRAQCMLVMVVFVSLETPPQNWQRKHQEAPEKVVVGERLSGTTFMKDFFT